MEGIDNIKLSGDIKARLVKIKQFLSTHSKYYLIISTIIKDIKRSTNEFDSDNIDKELSKYYKSIDNGFELLYKIIERLLELDDEDLYFDYELPTKYTDYSKKHMCKIENSLLIGSNANMIVFCIDKNLSKIYTYLLDLNKILLDILNTYGSNIVSDLDSDDEIIKL